MESTAFSEEFCELSSAVVSIVAAIILDVVVVSFILVDGGDAAIQDEPILSCSSSVQFSVLASVCSSPPAVMLLLELLFVNEALLRRRHCRPVSDTEDHSSDLVRRRRGAVTMLALVAAKFMGVLPSNFFFRYITANSSNVCVMLDALLLFASSQSHGSSSIVAVSTLHGNSNCEGSE